MSDVLMAFSNQWTVGIVSVILDGLVQAVIQNAQAMEQLLMECASVTLMMAGVASFATSLDVQELMSIAVDMEAVIVPNTSAHVIQDGKAMDATFQTVQVNLIAATKASAIPPSIHLDAWTVNLV